MGLVDGKVVIVTGVASGIGRASALAFAREGAKVVAADVMAEAGEETVKMIADAGGEAVFVKCDVSNEDDVKALVQAALDTYGKLDCAHNNAGIVGPNGTMIVDYAKADFDKLMSINCTGVFLCMKHEIPAMLAGGGGAIVNTASAAGLVANPGNIAYSASKFAVNGMTKSAAAEYGSQGIRVNSICPGFIETPMVAAYLDSEEARAAVRAMAPLNRWGQPEEMAEVAVWLASDRASFITAVNMPAEGGMTAV